MSAHREGVWTDDAGAQRPARTDGRRLALEGFGVAFVAATTAAFAAPVGLSLPAASVVVGGGTYGLLSRHADERRRAARSRARALREEFGVGPVWTVDLLVLQGDAPSGCDQGLMWVEGGRIVFSGLRTSFALVPAQTAGPVQTQAGLSGLRYRLSLPLARETAGGPLSVSFWPVAESLAGAEADAEALRRAVNAVAGFRDRTLEGTGQWPPVSPGPGVPARHALFARALAPHVAGTLAAAAIAAALVGVAPAFAGVAFVVLAATGNGAIYAESAPRWRAVRDARRLVR